MSDWCLVFPTVVDRMALIHCVRSHGMKSSRVQWTLLIVVIVSLTTSGVYGWSLHSPSEASTKEATAVLPSANENVYEVSDTSFSEFIKKEPSVLALFYAPWCHWCRDFLPRYAEAAILIKSQALPIKLIQIDASKHYAIADTYNIRGFPTLKLFLDGLPHEYNGGRTSTEVVKWVNSHLQTETLLTNKEQLDSLLELDQGIPTLIAHFDQPKVSKARQIFIELSRKVDSVGFAEINDNKMIDLIIEQHQAPKQLRSLKEFLLLINPHFKLHPEHETPTVLYAGSLVSKEEIEAFIKTYSFPAFIDFDVEVAPKLFRDGRPFFVLFTNGRENFEVQINSIRSLAEKHRHEILFIHSDGDSIYDKRLQSLLGIENENLPTIRLFHSNPNGHSNWYSTIKYRPSSSLLKTFDVKGLELFLQDFKNNKLKPFIKSEQIVDGTDNDESVKILVADQFEDLVKRSKKDVIVNFYAPWCGHCRKLEPVFNQVGDYLRHQKNIDVMKLDATQNEVNILILGYPTLVFFVQKEGHEKVAIYYNGERTAEAIISWIAEHASQKFDPKELISRSVKEGKGRGDLAQAGSSSSSGGGVFLEEL